jgi:hypothetical protein
MFVPAVREDFPVEPWVYEARILARTYVDEFGCWIWDGPLSPGGYGQVNAWQKRWLVHRLAYTVMVGEIPAGLQIDHLCRVRNCIRPDHLEPVTQAENLRRQGAAVTQCPVGHEYTAANTYRAPSAPNLRRCLACSRAYARAWQATARAARRELLAVAV